MDKALIVFVRNTEKGKVKTRIAREMGDEKALAIYKYLLQYTSEVATGVASHRFVFYTDYIHIQDAFDDNCFTKFLQEGDSLGSRMQSALQKVFDLGHEKVVIIGSDCYELQQEHIEDAFDKLSDADVVIGPSVDGGYYLLGMKQLHQKLFTGKDWGTSSVFDDTIRSMQELQLSVQELEPLNDIDTAEDVMATDLLAKCNLQE